MSFLRLMYATVLDALFPVPAAEEAVLSMNEERAFHTLPRASEFPVCDACSIFKYKDERVWRLIWSLKYKKSLKAAKIGGYALYEILRIYARVVDLIFVIPMPITRKRRRERGFNQCELLLDAVHEYDVSHGLECVTDLLVRARHKSRQTLKDREERLKSADHIFAVNEKVAENLQKVISGKKYLLIIIDDVVTTGSTIKDAVSTVRNAGFPMTFGLSVAH